MANTPLHQTGLPVVTRGRDYIGRVQSEIEEELLDSLHESFIETGKASIRVIRAARLPHNRCVHLARALIARDSSCHPVHRAIGAASHHARAVYDQHSAQSIADLLSHAIMEVDDDRHVVNIFRHFLDPLNSINLLSASELPINVQVAERDLEGINLPDLEFSDTVETRLTDLVNIRGAPLIRGKTVNPVHEILLKAPEINDDVTSAIYSATKPPPNKRMVIKGKSNVNFKPSEHNIAPDRVNYTYFLTVFNSNCSVQVVKIV